MVLVDGTRVLGLARLYGWVDMVLRWSLDGNNENGDGCSRAMNADLVGRAFEGRNSNGVAVVMRKEVAHRIIDTQHYGR
jgi:hypothetical protein